METIATLYEGLSNATIYFFLILGIWGIYRGFRSESVDGSYFGTLVIGEVLFIVVSILSIILLLNGKQIARPTVHILYAAFGIVFTPGIFFYLKGDDTNRAQWIFGFCSLFMAGIAVRLIQTTI